MNTETSSRIAFQKQLRHLQVAQQSDYLHLKQCVLNAASLFADMADIIEKDRTYDPVGFLRATAERFKAEAEAH